MVPRLAHTAYGRTRTRVQLYCRTWVQLYGRTRVQLYGRTRVLSIWVGDPE
eukprot:SAG11_NODE_25531_length_357_cov_1.604651_1_plen_50_part_10